MKPYRQPNMSSRGGARGGYGHKGTQGTGAVVPKARGVQGGIEGAGQAKAKGVQGRGG